MFPKLDAGAVPARYRFDGGALRRLRLDAGLTIEEEAVAIGRGWATVKSYELGRKVPPTEIVGRLCALFDCTPSDLLCPVEPAEVSR